MAQQLVAGRVAANIVHHLEPVEIQHAQDMLAVRRPLVPDQTGQPSFELAPVDKLGEDIVRGVVRQQVGNMMGIVGVVEQKHAAGQSAVPAYERHG